MSQIRAGKVAILNGTQRVVGTTDADWSSVSTGNYFTIDADNGTIYQIAAVNAFTYSSIFSGNGLSGTVFENAGINLINTDDAVFSYKQYQFTGIPTSFSAGGGYTSGAVLSVSGGIVASAGANPTGNLSGTIRVTNTGANGQITAFTILNSGVYTNPIGGTLNFIGATGTGAKFTWNYAEKNTITVDREVSNVNAGVSSTSFLLNYLLPTGVTTGIMSATKWEAFLTANYQGSNRTGAAYTIIKDFTARYYLPTLSIGDTQTAAIFSRAMNLIDDLLYQVDNQTLLSGDITTLSGMLISLSGLVTGTDFSITGTGANASGSLYKLITGVSGNLQGQINLLTSATGQYYPRSNPSGYITGINNVVLTTGTQIILGAKNFLSGVDISNSGLPVFSSTGFFLRDSGNNTGINWNNKELIRFNTVSSSNEVVLDWNKTALTGSLNTRWTVYDPVAPFDIVNKRYLTGISGAIISQISNQNTGVLSVNALTGSVTIFGTGLAFVINVGSGKLAISGSGITQSQFNALSGVFDSRLVGSGTNLQAQISTIANNTGLLVSKTDSPVYLTGIQTVSGEKNFLSKLRVGNNTSGARIDSSSKDFMLGYNLNLNYSGGKFSRSIVGDSTIGIGGEGGDKIHLFRLADIAFTGYSDVQISGAKITFDLVNSRVGIGTIAPSESLDVFGNIKLSGYITNTTGVLTGANWSTLSPISSSHIATKGYIDSIVTGNVGTINGLYGNITVYGASGISVTTTGSNVMYITRGPELVPFVYVSTLVPTGSDSFTYIYQRPFTGTPRTTVSLECPNTGYDQLSFYTVPSGVSGFTVKFSNVILQTGYRLNAIVPSGDGAYDALYNDAGISVQTVSGSNFTPDYSVATTFDYFLTGSVNTINQPSNLRNGKSITMKLTQTAAGGNTAFFSPQYKFQGGSDPIISNGGNQVDVVTVLSINGFLYSTIVKNIA